MLKYSMELITLNSPNLCLAINQCFHPLQPWKRLDWPGRLSALPGEKVVTGALVYLAEMHLHIV